jgi:hypothetical protein
MWFLKKLWVTRTTSKNGECWIGSVECLATRDLIGKALAENDPFIQFLLVEPMKFDNEDERKQTSLQSHFLMGFFPIDDSIRQGAVSLDYWPVVSQDATTTSATTTRQQPLAGCVLVRE